MERELLELRAGFYSLLSRLYRREADGALLKALEAADFPRDCSGDMAQGYAWLKAGLGEESDELAADYARVFLAAGIAQGTEAAPYESVYTSTKHLVMQEAWEQVKEIYAARGLCAAGPEGLYEDHIACELAYMALLCREGTQADQRAFLEEHLLNWAPAFCADVEAKAATDFYRGTARLTAAFLREERETLSGAGEETGFALSLTAGELDEALAALARDYRVYAPVRLKGRGARGGDLVRYGEITSADQIVTDAPSDFSPKEVFYPVMQTMFYFQGDQCRESELSDPRGLLIFARPCDINAIRRLDNIFLRNGGQADLYYQRLREKVKFVLLECPEKGWDTCFCVSMGANVATDYSLALRLEEGRALVEGRDPALRPYFAGGAACTFTPRFVAENLRRARLPRIPDREALRRASELEMWKDYDEQCIGCGGCNTVCPTCSCFDTVDVIYDETSRDGERRRVWSSCMLKDFTATAGGHRARSTPGANLRFKTLHKVYDYNQRFGGEEHMCVGCGRCDRRCPRDISFYDTVNRLHDALEEGKEGTK